MRSISTKSAHLRSRGITTVLDLAFSPARIAIKIRRDESIPAQDRSIIEQDFALLESFKLKLGMSADEIEKVIVKKMSADAVGIQNACNIVAVAGSFSEVTRALLWLANNSLKASATEWVSGHSITRAWVDKLASLAGVQSLDGLGMDNASTAHERCLAISEI